MSFEEAIKRVMEKYGVRLLEVYENDSTELYFMSDNDEICINIKEFAESVLW